MATLGEGRGRVRGGFVDQEGVIAFEKGAVALHTGLPLTERGHARAMVRRACLL